MNRPSECPACGSERIQKAKIIMRAGIPISTEISRKLCAPAEPTSATEPAGRYSTYVGASLLLMGVYTQLTMHTLHANQIGLFLQTAGVILVCLGASLWAMSQIKLNAKRPKYEEDYAKWEHLWYCSRCRNTFYES